MGRNLNGSSEWARRKRSATVHRFVLIAFVRRECISHTSLSVSSALFAVCSSWIFYKPSIFAVPRYTMPPLFMSSSVIHELNATCWGSTQASAGPTNGLHVHLWSPPRRNRWWTYDSNKHNEFITAVGTCPPVRLIKIN